MEIMEVGKTVKYRGELYRSGRMSKWRWRIVASNGKAKDILKVRIRFKLDEFNLIPKVLFATNPTKNWAYEQFYSPAKKGELPTYRQFVQAFAWDNPNYPESSLKSLREMPEGAEKERLYYGSGDSIGCDIRRAAGGGERKGAERFCSGQNEGNPLS